MFFEIDQYRIAYDDVGTGQEIILIHGFPLCKAMWGPQTGSLVSSGFRVITLDLPGFGESDPYPIESMADYADVICKLMQHLHLSRAVVGGMSMGGYILLNFMARYPERLEAGLLIVTKASADDETARGKRDDMISAVRDHRSEEVVETFKKVLFGPNMPADSIELVENWMSETSDSGIIQGAQAMKSRQDRTHTLKGISFPCWVLAAEKDEAIPVSFSRAMEQELPNCRLDVISDAGHMVNMEKSQEFNRLLLSFLDEIFAF